MNIVEEAIRINKMHDEFYSVQDEECESEWCDNCGRDLPLDGLTTIYQIPGQIECFCEKCFAKVVFDDCLLFGSTNEKNIVKSLLEEAAEKRKKTVAVMAELQKCMGDRLRDETL